MIAANLAGGYASFLPALHQLPPCNNSAGNHQKYYQFNHFVFLLISAFQKAGLARTITRPADGRRKFQPESENSHEWNY